jgi:predicted DsbA family dithiol-disulfide isomerase
MMRNQRALQDADLERIATEAGVDLATWNECRKDPAMAEEVRKDMADGEEAGVTGTPAFFINGVFLSGAQPYEKFKAIIDRELSQG